MVTIFGDTDPPSRSHQLRQARARVLAVNGAKAGEPMDFYNASVKPSAERKLGTFELREGENEFSATVVGANEKAVQSYMFGLDYLLLKPAE